jgi:hypothetical protein
MAALNNLVGRIRSATTRLANPGAAKAQKSFGVPLDPEATHVPLVLVKCIEVLRIKGSYAPFLPISQIKTIAFFGAFFISCSDPLESICQMQ